MEPFPGEADIMQTSCAVLEMDPEPVIYIVDDDASVRAGASFLMQSRGWKTRDFGSAEDFLSAYAPGQPGCLLLDLHMPGMNGVDLQRELAARGIDIPIIVITGQIDDPLAVRAEEAGALAVIAKPFRQADILPKIQVALGQTV